MALCREIKVNRRHEDFDCTLEIGHPGPHVTSVRGIRWKHPVRPYGVKNDPPSNGARSKTKHGSYFSTAAAGSSSR